MILDSIINKMIKNCQQGSKCRPHSVQEFIIARDPAIKKKQRQASMNQKYVEDAPVLIVVCLSTSRSVGRYGQRRRYFYRNIDGAFA
jgi:nitroreductase